MSLPSPSLPSVIHAHTATMIQGLDTPTPPQENAYRRTDRGRKIQVTEGLESGRLRAVSYFSLQSYCTRNLSTRAAKPRAARNEGVSPRGKK